MSEPMTKSVDETQAEFTVRVLRAEAWEQGYVRGVADCGPWQYTSSENPYAGGES